MPGIIIEDSDYSENGEIVVKRMLQCEYWSVQAAPVRVVPRCAN